ncbi:hypothetical protein [Parasitella parasitica]|uniref:Uncharacterized protein n=1 Tax=Parasitella parasitica TaxID=35722 RepID=A0A0B7MW50_9FUNG|nr:hypothetical protein [Parasitella parasitica]
MTNHMMRKNIFVPNKQKPYHDLAIDKPLSTTNPTQLQSAVVQLNQVNYEASQHVSYALGVSDKFDDIGESSSIVAELRNKIKA